jgi:4-hydroxy-tetrahydrodipicolinate reductase
MSRTRVVINGAAGRMGQRLIALATADAELHVVAALEYAEHPAIGQDAGQIAGAGSIGIPLAAELSCEADVVIDFSVPAGADAATRLCQERRIPLVAATTGLTETQKTTLMKAAESIPIVWAPNMSMAVNLTMKLTEVAADVLKNNPTGTDVEIIERHHRFKKDAPSGTALHFGEIIAKAMGQTQHTHGRQGIVGERPRDEIGYHALRVGDNPGEHTIVFGLLGETIELTVRATNRDCYALGALAAAKFLASQAPGLYGMDDVLGL